MMDELIMLQNCSIIKNGLVVDDDYLWIRNGKILDPMAVFFDEKAMADVTIDCKGALLSPGLIDIQVNGGFGIDFTNNYNEIEKGLKIVSEGLLQFGVTSFCPTLVSSQPEIYRTVLPKMGITTGAINLGVHVEGPFVNKKKVGAHSLHNIRTLKDGSKAILDMYGDMEHVRIITLAPEIDGALEVIKYLKKSGLVVSIGHSESNLKTAEAAVQNGATLMTHLFNAMVPFHHRDPGMIGLLTSTNVPPKSVYFGLICDGCHTDPAAVRLAYRTNFDGLILVTDAISAMGLTEGVHQIGELTIEIKNNCATIAGTNTLCGSIQPLNKCVKLFSDYTNCGVVKAIEAATLHPARVLGIEKKKGTLNPGADADIVFFDKNMDVVSTWINGKCVYSNGENALKRVNHRT